LLPQLYLFRLSLLKNLLLTASFFSILISLLSSFELFPIYGIYRIVLYIYGISTFIGYVVLLKNGFLYKRVVDFAIFGSVVVFAMMTYSVRDDEFRLVWFFLTAFASYILGGSKYGAVVTLSIVSILIYMYSYYDLALSSYAIFTFVCALVVFNLFAYVFLQKIQNDEALLQQRIQEAVEKQKNQEQFLLRQHRMASLGEMIDAIAHQWRQPLMQSSMVIYNIQEEMEEKSIQDSYITNKLDELVELNSHMSHTIDDFRTLLKTDKQKEAFDISTVIKETVTLLKNSLKDIHILYPTQEYKISSYKSEMIQVFIILISNAIEAFVNRDIKDAKIEIDIQTHKQYISIHITDNAGGIDSVYQDKIFEPYFSTKTKDGGSGLGLYIAKIIVEQSMKGVLSYHSVEGGSVFEIRIPNV